MRALPTLALALPLWFGSGCFVFDEIDAGMEIMEAHSPKSNKAKKKADAPDEGEKPPTYQQLVQSWWKDAKTLSVSPVDREESDDPMIPCAHAGKTVYTKRSDCVARGGNPG
jgi:hypothetical protein